MPCHEFCGIGHEGMWAQVQVIDQADDSCSTAAKRREAELCSTLEAARPRAFLGRVRRPSRGALLLGEWQMFVRSPLHAWVSNPGALLPLGDRARHGDGLRAADARRDGLRLRDHRARAEAAADRPALGVGRLLAGRRRHGDGGGRRWRSGKASVLYTFYPPMIGKPVLLPRRRAGRGRLVDLGRADVDQPARLEARQSRRAGAAGDVRATSPARISGRGPSVGAALELLFLILPVALGLNDTIDAGLARVFFSWTLHAIVYFWLMPTYIAFYTIVPRAIGGRLYSDTMGAHRLRPVPRVLDADRHPPPVRRSAGRRRLQVRACGVHRDGRGADAADGVHHRAPRSRSPAACAAAGALFGWVKALPWDNPMMLAVDASRSSCSASAAPAASST